MEKRKFVVQFQFKAEFETYTDGQALEQAAKQLALGFSKTKGLAIAVVACVPIPSENQPPAPQPIIAGTGAGEAKAVDPTHRETLGSA